MIICHDLDMRELGIFVVAVIGVAVGQALVQSDKQSAPFDGSAVHGNGDGKVNQPFGSSTGLEQVKEEELRHDGVSGQHSTQEGAEKVRTSAVEDLEGSEFFFLPLFGGGGGYGRGYQYGGGYGYGRRRR